MPQLIIKEYADRVCVDTAKHEASDFAKASAWLVRNLWNTSSPEYSAKLLAKWFTGPIMVGDDYGFDVRQYDGPVGSWTDFLYRP